MAMTIVGIDIGGTNVRAGVLRAGRLVAVDRRVHRESAYGERADYQHVIAIILQLIEELCPAERIDGVGISISGVLTSDRSKVASNMGLQWYSEALAADVARQSGLPAIMENDGNCAAWGEYILGVGRGKDPFVLLTLGTGVGGGTVVNGELVRGVNGAAGELGHICVVTGGRECACGSFGCVEQYSSGRALLGEYARLTHESGEDGVASWGRLGDVIPLRRYQALQAKYAGALAAREAPAMEALRAITQPLAAAIAQIARTIDPALIALTGGVGALGEPLVAQLRHDIAAYPAASSRRLQVPVELGQLGENAGLAGAALLGLQAVSADRPDLVKPEQKVSPI